MLMAMQHQGNQMMGPPGPGGIRPAAPGLPPLSVNPRGGLAGAGGMPTRMGSGQASPEQLQMLMANPEFSR